jgi:hypothetical protein
MDHTAEIIDNLEAERQQCFLDHIVNNKQEYIFPEPEEHYTMEDILDEDFAL